MRCIFFSYAVCSPVFLDIYLCTRTHRVTDTLSLSLSLVIVFGLLALSTFELCASPHRTNPENQFVLTCQMPYTHIIHTCELYSQLYRTYNDMYFRFIFVKFTYRCRFFIVVVVVVHCSNDIQKIRIRDDICFVKIVWASLFQMKIFKSFRRILLFEENSKNLDLAAFLSIKMVTKRYCRFCSNFKPKKFEFYFRSTFTVCHDSKNRALVIFSLSFFFCSVFFE